MKTGFLITAILFLLSGAPAAYAENGKALSDEKERKNEPYVYDHGGKRDPFVPLLGVTSAKVNSLEDILSVDDVSLQGIAFDSTGKKAVIINSEMVREGEGGGRLTVKKILKDSVILTIDEEEYRLDLYSKKDN